MAKFDEQIKEAASWLCAADKVMVLSGAGISRESGIPTFRDAQEGLWQNYDPAKLASPSGFLADPGLVWRWYEMRRRKVRQAEPNRGHYALVEIEKLVPTLIVVTQNVDGLHSRAGTNLILELHGNIFRNICFEQRHAQNRVEEDLDAPPRCACGSLIRPAVVWFGEALAETVLAEAIDLAQAASVVLVVGTSGIVYPAASLPYIAKEAGARVIEVNVEATPISRIADLFIEGKSASVLPAILASMRKQKQ